MINDENFDCVRIVASSNVKPNTQCDWKPSSAACTDVAKWLVDMQMPVVGSEGQWRIANRLRLCSHCSSQAMFSGDRR